MARHTNFLDGNDNFREQNLRFVRNEMEDNFNQFFGGSNNNNGGNAGINNAPNVAAPPRDSKVVQPTPDIDIDPLMPAITKIELEQRRLFMREIGFSRSAAHSAAADSLQVPDFNMHGLQQRRVDMFLEQGSRKWVDVDAKIVREIRSLIESHQQRPKDRPATSSSSSDINWIEDNIAGAVGSLSNARERDASPENYGLVRRTDENFHALQTRNSKRREEREIERKQLAERNNKFVGRQQQFDNLRRRNDRSDNNNNNHRDFQYSNNQFGRRPKQNIDINNNNNCGFMNRNSNYVDFNQRNGNWDKENYYHGNFNQYFDSQNFNGCHNEYLNFYQDNNYGNQNFNDCRNEYSNYFHFNQSNGNFGQENNYHGNYNQNFGNQNFNGGRYPNNFGNNNFHGCNNNIYDYRNSYWAADSFQANFEDNFQKNNWDNFNENHYNFDFNGMLNNGGHLNFGNAFQFGYYGNQTNWNNHQNNNINRPRAFRKPAINKKQQPQPPKQATDKKEVKNTTTTDKKIEQKKQVIEQKGEQKKKIEQKKQVIEQKIEQKKQVIEQKEEQKKQVIEQKGEQKKKIEQNKQVIEQKGEQKKEIEQKKQVIKQKGEQKKPASAASSINNNKTEKKPSNVLPKPTTTAAKENVEKRTATEPLQSGKAKKQKYDGKKRGFIVAGVKLPYVKPNTQMPQPEEKSYAVTFFEHKPIYNTSIYAVDNDGDMDKYEDGYDTDNEFEIGGPTIRKRINNNWSRIYEERNYKCWLTWWKAFKWCELQINKKLKSFGSLNIKHKFLPYYKKQMSTQDVIINLMNRARFSLETKSNNFRDFKIIYELMNETFLENLLPATAEQLQHMIRKIPNHLWLYKMRRMVYIWAEYYKLSDNLTYNFAGVQMRWKSPAFHWLCKQAFDELKTLSTIEWPKHKEMYNKLKSVKS